MNLRLMRRPRRLRHQAHQVPWGIQGRHPGQLAAKLPLAENVWRKSQSTYQKPEAPLKVFPLLFGLVAVQPAPSGGRLAKRRRSNKQPIQQQNCTGCLIGCICSSLYQKVRRILLGVGVPQEGAAAAPPAGSHMWQRSTANLKATNLKHEQIAVWTPIQVLGPSPSPNKEVLEGRPHMQL